MKTNFTKEYIIDNKGCYSLDQVESLKCINNKKITLKQLFKELPIKDFSWFFVKKCDLTLEQKQLFALYCAEQVLPIFEERYPRDKRLRECIEATKLFLDGNMTHKELLLKRYAAYADAAYAAYADAAYAYADADAAADAAYAAYAAAAAAHADAAADAADAADAAYAAAAAAHADAAADAADAADAAYKESIWKFVESIK